MHKARSLPVHLYCVVIHHYTQLDYFRMCQICAVRRSVQAQRIPVHAFFNIFISDSTFQPKIVHQPCKEHSSYLSDTCSELSDIKEMYTAYFRCIMSITQPSLFLHSEHIYKHSVGCSFFSCFFARRCFIKIALFFLYMTFAIPNRIAVIIVCFFKCIFR